MENNSNPLNSSSHGYEEAPTASSDLVWRAEIVKQLFGDVGDVITDFTCAVESNILLHGRMYVTNRFLCFYSNLFGLEKKIRIPYSHISHITKENTALVIPNAIAITTFRKEYIFRSFWDRDEAFNMLKDLVNKFKGIDTIEVPDSGSGSLDISTQGIKSSSTNTTNTNDVSNNASVSTLSTTNTANTTTSNTIQPTSIPPPLNNTNSGSRRHSLPNSINTDISETSAQSSPIRPLSTPHQSSISTINSNNSNPTTPSISNTSQTQSQSQTQLQTQSQSQSTVLSTPQGKDVINNNNADSLKLKSNDDNEFDTESGREELDRRRGSTTTNSAELLEAFEKEVTNSKQKIIIKSVKIPITVAEFCQLFVVDNARYGYPKYHEDNGDKEIVVTPWEDDSTALGSAREIRFLKPVAIPGMPYARAKKIQRYRRYGNVGVLVCSSTRMEDVPAADTFTVEDCVSVKSTGPKEVLVEANFDIKWLKSTFFRRVIEGGTLPDVTKWLETYLIKMKDIGSNSSNIESSTSSQSTESTNTTTEVTKTSENSQVTPTVSTPTTQTISSSNNTSDLTTSTSTNSTISPTILYFIIAILLMVLIFVGFELYQLAYSISLLRSQIAQLTQQIEKIPINQNLLCQNN